MIDCATCTRALFGSRACIIVYAQAAAHALSIDKLYSLLLVYVNHARTTLCFVRLFHLFPILPSSSLFVPSSFSLIIRLRCFRLFVFVSSSLKHIHARPTWSPWLALYSLRLHCSGRTAREYRHRLMPRWRTIRSCLRTLLRR